MPHDVTMPQLGMAQDAGKIVSWLKSPGDAVSKGDALFEVETDKAVMEVEAPAAGFLTGVKAEAGEDVPVGQVIARISDSADDPGEDEAEAAAPAPAEAAPAGGDDLPDGHSVTMPQLGMAQDSGVLVSWLKSPGDQVAADDVLFEVETDKSTMEVEAHRAGWLAATLAEAGEEVPVGAPVAIISDAEPATTVARSVKEGAAAPAAAPADPEAEVTAAPDAPAKPAAVPASGGRILASPKARRLALEQGLDLQRLVEAGHPQPYHVADLEVLRNLPAPAAAPSAGVAASRRLTATCAADGVAEFAAWAVDQGVADADAVLAGLAAASLGDGAVTVGVERFGTVRAFDVPVGRALSGITESDSAPALLVRDLRGSRISGVEMGAEAVPVLTIATADVGLSITLECGPGALEATAAIQLLSDFAGRMEQPLRHLL